MNLFRLLLQTSVFDFTVAILAGLVSGVSAAGLIALINIMLNQNQPTLTTVVWIFVALCLIRLIGNFASQVLLIRLSQTAILDLRMLLSRCILASPLRHLEEMGAHRLLAALTDDIQAISNTATILPFFFINVAILVGCQIYLLWLSPSIFVLSLVFLILAIGSYQLPITKALTSLKIAREQEDNLFKHFHAVTHGIKELKLHRRRRQAFFAEELQKTVQIYRHHHIIGNVVYAAAASWGQSLLFIGIGLLLFALPAIQEVSHRVLSGYALTVIFMMKPLEYLMTILPPLTQAIVSLQKIESLGLSLSAHPADSSLSALIEPNIFWKRLELIDVTHAYYQEREENSFTLGPINLVFNSGEIVFIVGGNGSGKSTLAKLITGLYIPEDGEIYLDDQLIDHEHREWYRQQFSVVFADFYLFDRLLGINSDTLNNQTQNYLVRLQLDHKVQVKDGVLSTTELSQGQRKRLALLTAYLDDRPIYLFDEWAADQDPFFKKIFYTQLLPELKSRGKTVLVISHDDQYFYLADQIVKLEYGRVKYDQHTPADFNTDTYRYMRT